MQNNAVRISPADLKELRLAFAEWMAGEIYVCKKTGAYRYRFGSRSKSKAFWSATATRVFNSPAEFATAAAAAGVTPAAAKPTPTPVTPPKVRTPRVKPAPKIPKTFSDFLATRCKSLALAAKVLGIKPKPPLQKSVVRAAWISLVRIHHPDKGGALEAAQAVNAAYQLLEKFSQ
jgi:hypothetical protein